MEDEFAKFRQWGRQGGLKGGPARREALSAKSRRLIAQKAARARWDKAKAKLPE